MSEVLLEVKNLSTFFYTAEGVVKAVNDVSYHVNKQEIVAIVGESGCGKSVTQLSSTQLVQSPPGKIVSGEILLEGRNLLEYGRNSKEMQAVRGAEIAEIFQEPMTSLNPVLTVGKQLSDVIMTHSKCTKKEAWAKAVEALKAVGIPDPESRVKNYPFEMSGGMRQRVMIATAIACNSKLIIADEPTTALDVTTQAQVMDLLQNLVKTRGLSVILVTHNLGLVTRYADRVYVMYAGRIIEQGTTEMIMKRPKHPYTIGLMSSVPKLNDSRDEKLIPIEGAPPLLTNLPDRCAFFPRCRFACDKCEKLPYPEYKETEEKNHYAACHVSIGGAENV